MFALRHFPVGASQEPIERLLRLIATERTQVVMLVVEVNLASAEVVVDDKRIGVAPLRDEFFLEVAAEANVTGEIGTAWRVSLALEQESLHIARRCELPGRSPSAASWAHEGFLRPAPFHP